MMLSDRFQKVITELGMAALEQPLFYHAPVGIRFEIGGEEPVYLDTEPYRPNPAYINDALKRARTIYEKLPEPPDLLRIDSCPDEEDEDTLVSTICRRAGLHAPHQQKIEAAALPDSAPSGNYSFTGICLNWNFARNACCGRSFWATSADGPASCPASIWQGRGRFCITYMMTGVWIF